MELDLTIGGVGKMIVAGIVTLTRLMIREVGFSAEACSSYRFRKKLVRQTQTLKLSDPDFISSSLIPSKHEH